LENGSKIRKLTDLTGFENLSGLGKCKLYRKLGVYPKVIL
jgi:hypothetical protein